MVRIRMKAPLSRKTLDSIGIKPYRDWDEEEKVSECQDLRSDLIQITPDNKGKIPRPYSGN